MRSLHILLFLILSQLVHIQSYGHVTLITPKEDTVYAAGELVNIEWTLDITHEQLNWDIWYSIDQGMTWTAIAIDLPITQLSYQWMLPGRPYERFRVQVIQDNEGRDYHDTNQFDIGMPRKVVTALNDVHPSPREFLLSLSSNPVNYSSRVIINAEYGGVARISVYDQSGKEILQVFTGVLSPGKNEFPLIPQNVPIPIKPGLYILKIQSRESVEAIRFLYPN